MGGLGSSGLNIERDHCVLQKRKRKKKKTTFARLQTKKEGQVAYCRPWVVHSSDRLTACFVTGPWTKHFVMVPAAWPFQLPDLKWWWWLHCRYPCFENPYPMDLHESPVTACQYYANCPTDLIPAFYSVGSKQKKTGFSEKVAWHWNENAGEMRVFCIRVVLCCFRCGRSKGASGEQQQSATLRLWLQGKYGCTPVTATCQQCVWSNHLWRGVPSCGGDLRP